MEASLIPPRTSVDVLSGRTVVERRLAAVAALLLLAGPGCVEGRARDVPPWHLSMEEAASYSTVTSLPGTSATNRVDVTLQTTGERAAVSVSMADQEPAYGNQDLLRRTPPASQGRVDFDWSLGTGRIPKTSAADWTRTNLPGQDWFPIPYDIDLGLMTDFAAPIGPQRFAVGRTADASWVVDNGTRIDVRVQPSGWTAHVAKPCDFGCAFNSPSFQNDTWILDLGGDFDHLLPSWATWHDARGQWRVNMTATSKAASGGPLRLPVIEPTSHAVAPFRPCGLLPCEPAAWRRAWSLQAAWAAVEQDPRWSSWPYRDGARIVAADVEPGMNPLPQLTHEEVQVRAWHFSVLSADGAHLRFFEVTAEGSFSQDTWSPFLISAQDGNVTSRYPPVLGVAPLDVQFDAARALGCQPDAQTEYGIEALSSVFVNGGPAAIQASFQTPDGTWCTVSAVDGVGWYRVALRT